MLVLFLPLAAVGVVAGTGALGHTITLCRARREYMREVAHERGQCAEGIALPEKDPEAIRRECLGEQYYSPLSARLLPRWGQSQGWLSARSTRSASEVSVGTSECWGNIY